MPNTYHVCHIFYRLTFSGLQQRLWAGSLRAQILPAPGLPWEDVTLQTEFGKEKGKASDGSL